MVQIDKAVSQFTFKPSERKRAAGPERLRAGRRRDELKLAVSKEEILADQSDIKNKTQVDDDGVVVSPHSRLSGMNIELCFPFSICRQTISLFSSSGSTRSTCGSDGSS